MFCTQNGRKFSHRKNTAPWGSIRINTVFVKTILKFAFLELEENIKPYIDGNVALIGHLHRQERRFRSIGTYFACSFFEMPQDFYSVVLCIFIVVLCPTGPNFRVLTLQRRNDTVLLCAIFKPHFGDSTTQINRIFTGGYRMVD